MRDRTRPLGRFAKIVLLLYRSNYSQYYHLSFLSHTPHVVKITAEQEEQIVAALTAKPHASQVARDTGWSFSTVWRVADGNSIPLTAGRETMGRPRLPPEVWAKVEREVAANPDATQAELARKTGVSRSSVGRVVRARRSAEATPA